MTETGWECLMALTWIQVTAVQWLYTLQNGAASRFGVWFWGVMMVANVVRLGFALASLVMK